MVVLPISWPLVAQTGRREGNIKGDGEFERTGSDWGSEEAGRVSLSVKPQGQGWDEVHQCGNVGDVGEGI